jgi:Spy/CpxP family protein refolding chaperone
MIVNIYLRRAAAWAAAGGLCLTLVAGTVQAAPEGQAGRPAKRAGQARHARLLALAETLNLTGEQRAKLHDLDARYRRQARETRRGTDDTTLRHTRMKSLKKQFRSDFLAILTPEQRAQLKAERRKARLARRSAQGAERQ